MNVDKEYICCAATWFDDGKKYDYQPINIDSGIVLCAINHAAIYRQIGGLVGQRKELGIHEKEQGFLTNKNRFVGRDEGFKIAQEQGQIIRKHGCSDTLYSEDIFNYSYK